MHVSANPRGYPRPRVQRAGSQAGDVLHDEPRAWIAELRGPAAVRDAAVADLHALLLRGARFEVNRRRQALAHVSPSEVDDLAMQAADDALVAILAKLDGFR